MRARAACHRLRQLVSLPRFFLLGARVVNDCSAYDAAPNNTVGLLPRVLAGMFTEELSKTVVGGKMT